MLTILRKFFDTSDRDVKALNPQVELINSLEPEFKAMSDEQIKERAAILREKAKAGESLDAMLPQVFAMVREVGHRVLHMRLFDVQLIGGMVLHQGRIAEMKTGEGKTLVAAAPLVLNALTGKGAHLVTVNDYLARRDAVWMGPIYHFLGLTVGIVQGQSVDSDELGGSYQYTPGTEHEDPRYMNLTPISRREAYLCDIVYGTNHEFGFDYLRDNMAFEVDQLSMAELNFAIIDEVDSILIDEARTPHIISGPSNDDVSVYKVVDAIVKQLEPEKHWAADKKNHSASLTEEGMDLIEQMMGLDNIASDPKLFHHVNASVKAYALFDRDKDYVVRSNEVVIVDENTGRMMFGRRYSDGLHQALEAKEGVQVQRESQTVAVITFQNLFRLYEKLAGMTGTAKTEEDEFRKIYGLDVVSVPTHRPMTRVDNDDIVYKSEDAKWRGVATEVLRLFTKQQPVLVGTRSIDTSEVVSHRLTSDMLQRLLVTNRLYTIKETQKGLDKTVSRDINDLCTQPLDQVDRQILSELCHKAGIPGDPLDSDHATWFFKQHGLAETQMDIFNEALMHGIPHNVLNAKYHEREALIISEAGRKGQVTIATNMAGRGVDILLGGRVADATTDKEREEEAADNEDSFSEYANTYSSYRRGGKERAAPPLPLDDQERRGLAEEVRALGGMFILGTERHESRRIDNQLRGRAGRQGDPGESRFFVSLEDQLWKIFNAKMLENPLLKAWPPLEQVNASFLSGTIKKTQERIENHFFESRKHVLEYDDVLNSQREYIYARRRAILLGSDVTEELKLGIDHVIEDYVNSAWTLDEDMNKVYDGHKLFNELNELFPLIDYVAPSEFEDLKPGPELVAQLQEIAHEAYEKKKEGLSEEMVQLLQQRVMLKVINDRWMDHLQTLEYIREGIGLRGYGQVDPLVAYKRETYDLFQSTERQIRDQSVRLFFRAQVQMDQSELETLDHDMAEAGPMTMTAIPTGDGRPKDWPTSVDATRVGRNDACPCGSGQKFKNCHYPILRAEGKL